MLRGRMAVDTKTVDLPPHLQRFRAGGAIDLTRPPASDLSNEDRRLLLRAAIAEGDADIEAGRVEDSDIVFHRLRDEFRY